MLLEERMSVREIADEIGVSRMTVYRAMSASGSTLGDSGHDYEVL